MTTEDPILHQSAPLVVHQRHHRPTSLGLTALMSACQHGNEAEVRSLLHRKPSLTSTLDRSGKTALHYCAENSSVGCAELLLYQDPGLVSVQDEEGYTTLHFAVISGNRTMVRFLLDRGADVNCVDNEKHSCVHWASVCGELECIDILVEYGANPSTPDIHGAYPIHYAAQMCGPNSEMGNDVRIGLAVLRKLISLGVDVNVQDQDGRQPLLWAASAETRPSKTYCPSGSSDAIVALVNAGADVAATDKDGLTALHCAASRGHVDCLETLISLCGAEVDTVDSNGCSALFYSVTLGHADCTQLLLKYGALPNRQDRKGRTPAHCGAAKGQLETLKILSQNGANLWMRNVRGDLPLHEAVQSGRKDLVQWLLDQQPSAVNAPNNNGRTCLHVAAITNSVEICKVLMDRKADVNPVMRSSKGHLMTPLDAAIYRGNRGCAKYLLLHGALPFSKMTDRHDIDRWVEQSLTVNELHKSHQLHLSDGEAFSPQSCIISDRGMEEHKHKMLESSVQTDSGYWEQKDADVQVHLPQTQESEKGLKLAEDAILEHSPKSKSDGGRSLKQAIITNVYVRTSGSRKNATRRRKKQQHVIHSETNDALDSNPDENPSRSENSDSGDGPLEESRRSKKSNRNKGDATIEDDGKVTSKISRKNIVVDSKGRKRIEEVIVEKHDNLDAQVVKRIIRKPSGSDEEVSVSGEVIENASCITTPESTNSQVSKGRSSSQQSESNKKLLKNGLVKSSSKIVKGEGNGFDNEDVRVSGGSSGSEEKRKDGSKLNESFQTSGQTEKNQKARKSLKPSKSESEHSDHSSKAKHRLSSRTSSTSEGDDSTDKKKKKGATKSRRPSVNVRETDVASVSGDTAKEIRDAACSPGLKDGPPSPSKISTVDSACSPTGMKPNTADTACSPAAVHRQDTIDSACSPSGDIHPDTADAACSPAGILRADTIDSACGPIESNNNNHNIETLDAACSPLDVLRKDTVDGSCSPSESTFPETADTACSPAGIVRTDTIDSACSPTEKTCPETTETACSPATVLRTDTIDSACSPSEHLQPEMTEKACSPAVSQSKDKACSPTVGPLKDAACSPDAALTEKQPLFSPDSEVRRIQELNNSSSSPESDDHKTKDIACSPQAISESNSGKKKSTRKSVGSIKDRRSILKRSKSKDHSVNKPELKDTSTSPLNKDSDGTHTLSSDSSKPASPRDIQPQTKESSCSPMEKSHEPEKGDKADLKTNLASKHKTFLKSKSCEIDKFESFPLGHGDDDDDVKVDETVREKRESFAVAVQTSKQDDLDESPTTFAVYNVSVEQSPSSGVHPRRSRSKIVSGKKSRSSPPLVLASGRKRRSLSYSEGDNEQSPESSVRSSDQTHSTHKDSGFSDMDRFPENSSSDEKDDEGHQQRRGSVSDSAATAGLPERRRVRKLRRRKPSHEEFDSDGSVDGSHRRGRTDQGRRRDDEAAVDRGTMTGRAESVRVAKKAATAVPTSRPVSDGAKQYTAEDITMAVQESLRKYRLERQLFSELQELKRHQIRSGRTNENVLVKRLVDKYKAQIQGPGMKTFQGPYTFRNYERFLYGMLRELSTSNEGKIPPKFKKDDFSYEPTTAEDPTHCVNRTYRCHHAMDAYQGGAPDGLEEDTTSLPPVASAIPSANIRTSARSRDDRSASSAARRTTLPAVLPSPVNSVFTFVKNAPSIPAKSSIYSHVKSKVFSSVPAPSQEIESTNHVDGDHARAPPYTHLAHKRGNGGQRLKPLDKSPTQNLHKTSEDDSGSSNRLLNNQASRLRLERLKAKAADGETSARADRTLTSHRQKSSTDDAISERESRDRLSRPTSKVRQSASVEPLNRSHSERPLPTRRSISIPRPRNSITASRNTSNQSLNNESSDTKRPFPFLKKNAGRLSVQKPNHRAQPETDEKPSPTSIPPTSKTTSLERPIRQFPTRRPALPSKSTKAPSLKQPGQTHSTTDGANEDAPKRRFSKAKKDSPRNTAMLPFWIPHDSALAAHDGDVQSSNKSKSAIRESLGEPSMTFKEWIKVRSQSSSNPSDVYEDGSRNEQEDFSPSPGDMSRRRGFETIREDSRELLGSSEGDDPGSESGGFLDQANNYLMEEASGIGPMVDASAFQGISRSETETDSGHEGDDILDERIKNVQDVVLETASRTLQKNVSPTDTVTVQLTPQNSTEKYTRTLRVSDLLTATENDIVVNYVELKPDNVTEPSTPVGPSPVTGHPDSPTSIASDDEGVLTFEIRHGREKNIFWLPTHKIRNNRKWQITFIVAKNDGD